MTTQQSLRDISNLRLRFQINNRLRLECLAALSRVFRELGENLSDELLSSIVFAIPEELPGERPDYGVTDEPGHFGSTQPPQPPPPQPPQPRSRRSRPSRPSLLRRSLLHPSHHGRSRRRALCFHGRTQRKSQRLLELRTRVARPKQASRQN